MNNTSYQIQNLVWGPHVWVFKLRLSMGRARSILDPTRTRPTSVKWRAEEPETDSRKNWSSQFRVRGERRSIWWIAKIKKKSSKSKEKKKVAEIWKMSPESTFFLLKIAGI